MPTTEGSRSGQRMRHTMYGRLLATEVIALLRLRVMQQEPRLTSLVYLLISGVAVLTTTPILQMSWSPPTEARPTSRTIYFERGGLPTLLTLKWMWLSAVLTELIWQYAIWFPAGWPSLAIAPSLPGISRIDGLIIPWAVPSPY